MWNGGGERWEVRDDVGKAGSVHSCRTSKMTGRVLMQRMQSKQSRRPLVTRIIRIRIIEARGLAGKAGKG